MSTKKKLKHYLFIFIFMFNTNSPIHPSIHVFMLFFLLINLKNTPLKFLVVAILSKGR